MRLDGRLHEADGERDGARAADEDVALREEERVDEDVAGLRERRRLEVHLAHVDLVVLADAAHAVPDHHSLPERVLEQSRRVRVVRREVDAALLEAGQGRELRDVLVVVEAVDAALPVWKSPTGLGGPAQTSNLSRARSHRRRFGRFWDESMALVGFSKQ